MSERRAAHAGKLARPVAPCATLYSMYSMAAELPCRHAALVSPGSCPARRPVSLFFSALPCLAMLCILYLS